VDNKNKMHQSNKLKVFSGTANKDLAEAVAKYTGNTLGKAEVSRYPDGWFLLSLNSFVGEIRVQILENVRGADVFVSDYLSCLKHLGDSTHLPSSERQLDGASLIN
jgi:phosphoribosylpyrophosphate synthetase